MSSDLSAGVGTEKAETPVKWPSRRKKKIISPPIGNKVQPFYLALPRIITGFLIAHLQSVFQGLPRPEPISSPMNSGASNGSYLSTASTASTAEVPLTRRSTRGFEPRREAPPGETARMVRARGAGRRSGSANAWSWAIPAWHLLSWRTMRLPGSSAVEVVSLFNRPTTTGRMGRMETCEVDFHLRPPGGRNRDESRPLNLRRPL